MYYGAQPTHPEELNKATTSASIVLYNTDETLVKRVLKSVLESNASVKLFLIDNSPTDGIQNYIANHENIIYIHNPSNPGFGAAHNLAIFESIKLGYLYHFIVNPDIYFDGDVIGPMVNYMIANPRVGMLMPKVLYPNGDIQYLPKLLPSFAWIIRRKLKLPHSTFKQFIDNYELRNVPADIIYNSPILSGCFTLLKLEAIKEVGGYDDSFFMYFEDFDLSRRIHKKYKTIYYPNVSVYHEYESGANKNIKLFKIFLASAFRYFTKWGWFFDSDRKEINKRTLSQFK